MSRRLGALDERSCLMGQGFYFVSFYFPTVLQRMGPPFPARSVSGVRLLSDRASVESRVPATAPGLTLRRERSGRGGQLAAG
jgi:hypothetical protein